MNPNETQPKSKGPRRKPYRSPRLVVYGDLRRLTKMAMPPAAKFGLKGDGAGVPMTRL